MKTASNTSAEKARLRENARCASCARPSIRTRTRTPTRRMSTTLPAVAENGREIHSHLGLQLNQSAVMSAGRRAPPQDHDRGSAAPSRGLQRRVEARPEPATPRSCWRTASAEKHIRPSVPQPKVWAKKTINEIGTKKIAAKPQPPEPAEPQPQAEREEGERHRQREIDEAEDERVAVDQQQARTARSAARDYAPRARPTGSRPRQRRDRQDDELYRRARARRSGPAVEPAHRRRDCRSAPSR